MNGLYYCNITEREIMVAHAFAFVGDSMQGATTSFIGTIRNHNLGKNVIGVSYDVHEKLALKVLDDICQEVLQQFDQYLKIYIEHFKGRLAIGGISVIVAVSAIHRDEAFKACRYIIEAIKHRCPIWKQEHYIDGNTEWIKGHELCSSPSQGERRTLAQ